MNNGTKIGLVMFVIGLIMFFLYGIYQGFQKISLENIDYFGTSILIIILTGLAVLFISVLIEQQEDKKKMKNEIKKEDFEP